MYRVCRRLAAAEAAYALHLYSWHVHQGTVPGTEADLSQHGRQTRCNECGNLWPTKPSHLYSLSRNAAWQFGQTSRLRYTRRQCKESGNFLLLYTTAQPALISINWSLFRLLAALVRHLSSPSLVHSTLIFLSQNHRSLIPICITRSLEKSSCFIPSTSFIVCHHHHTITPLCSIPDLKHKFQSSTPVICD